MREEPLPTDDVAPGTPARGSALEVLGVSTRLGLTSFGGPIAHLGYFREEYVVAAEVAATRRRTPISSRSASSCPVPRAARSASASA